MDNQTQQSTIQKSIHQQDISTIIKYFSFTIQQRFEQIQKNYHYFTCLNSINYEKSDIQKDILNRYIDYKATDQKEIKLLEKLVERIIQIFQFFREKTEQPQIIQSMAQKITEKLKQILKNQSHYNFFVNNRPKTHITQVKPLGSRSVSNDFLSIVGPSCKQQIDINSIFINNSKKTRTQNVQKKSVDVGKLFKYIFSVLKRGYLIKLRMEKPEKKKKTAGLHELSLIEQNATISIQGTCAILTNCTEKTNKQNLSLFGGEFLHPGKQRLNAISAYHNKKQFYIYQKAKNRSISTNQCSILSKKNVSVLKQSSSKIKEIDKKIANLYDVLNIQRYVVVKIAKDPDYGKKDQLKRNLFITNQLKKFINEYNRWISKGPYNPEDVCQTERQQNNEENSQNDLSKKSGIYPQQFVKLNRFCSNKEQFQTPEDRIIEIEPHRTDIEVSSNGFAIPNNIKTQQSQPFNKGKNQQNQDFNPQTIVVFSERKNCQMNNTLEEKSNFMKPSQQNTSIKDSSSSQSNQGRKALRLNLPSMLGDHSNLMNQVNVRLSNFKNEDRQNNKPQKPQNFLQSYFFQAIDDNSFVPLLPRRQKNSQNIYQSKPEVVAIKRKNIVPNFHPLNRCRIFREKKANRTSSVIQETSGKISAINEGFLKGKLKNIIL